MVDTARIERYLTRLDELVGDLERCLSDGKERYLTDTRFQFEFDHVLQITIQCCIDIALHIVSERELGYPESYGDAFLALAGAGYVDRTLAESLATAAGQRNAIAHGYIDLDRELLWTNASSGLSDFQAFAMAVGKLI